MLKKILLSSLIGLSHIAAGNINLNLDLMITDHTNTHTSQGNVSIEENTPVSITFDELDSLFILINAQRENEIVNLQVQFFQQVDTDEPLPLSELFVVQVPFDQLATITLNEPDNSGSLVLSITPTTIDSSTSTAE